MKQNNNKSDTLWYILYDKKLDKTKSNKKKKLHQHNKERNMKKTNHNLYGWGNN
jgi:hypothetical protein